jgi:hypothetical protein
MKKRIGSSSIVKKNSGIPTHQHSSKPPINWNLRTLVNQPDSLRTVLRNQKYFNAFKRELQTNGYRLEEDADSLRASMKDQSLRFGFVIRDGPIIFFIDDPTGRLNRPKKHFSQTFAEQRALLLKIAGLVQSPTNVQKKTEEAKYIHKVKIKHLGITTSEKQDEHIFTPAPDTFESRSGDAFNFDLQTFPTGVKIAKTQRDMRKIEFKKANSKHLRSLEDTPAR